MRFLLFNAAVVAALIYLLSADRSEFQAAADRLYDTVSRVEDAARDGIERVGSAARDSVPFEAATSEAVPVRDRARPTIEAAASQDEPREEEGRTRQSEPDPKPERPRRLAAETAPETVPPAPAPGATAPSGPGATAPSGETAQAALVRDLPPVDDPAVAKRRAEVLDGIAALDSAPVPPAPEIAAPEVAALEVALAEGETLMSPEERRRELYTLAEEMELLFVTKLTR